MTEQQVIDRDELLRVIGELYVQCRAYQRVILEQQQQHQAERAPVLAPNGALLPQ